MALKNIGVLLYTYNRVDDAKINQEIIRNVWEKESFEGVKIVHAYNGLKEWYPERFLEDDLIRVKNSWHFQGASDLIDAGMKAFQKRHKTVDLVIVLASDTWLVKPEYVAQIIERMRNEQLYLATCAWGSTSMPAIADAGAATDFFVIDVKWAMKYKLFPIRYKEFHQKYWEWVGYQKGGNILLEKLFLLRYLEAVSREENTIGLARQAALAKALLLKEREPIHFVDDQGRWVRHMHWPEMGLLTHHDPVEKQKALRASGVFGGETVEKFLQSDDLSYFNQGVGKMRSNPN